MPEPKQHISIWFFIGLMLIVYGVLILGAGLYGLGTPPERTVELADLHAGIWWGALLLVLGIVYTYLFAPGRQREHL
jgi:hypothetical protein